MKKTNAIRELETHKIEHIVREYEVDEDHLDALSVAIKTNEDITRIFKTLVLLNEKKEMIVACIPGLEKLDLKKLAKKTLENINKREIEASLKIIGCKELFSGCIISLSDAGEFSGKYVVTRLQHNFPKFITSIEMYKIKKDMKEEKEK